MNREASIRTVGVLGFALLVSVSIAWGGPSTTDYTGDLLDVDKDTGRIVVGDMGPLLDDGTSKMTRRSIRVTPSTEFATVKRASGAAPSGWIGDYVETGLPKWEVKPGDFVAIKVMIQEGEPEAVKITVVNTSSSDVER